MNKFLKIIALLAGLAIALVAGLTVYLKIAYPPERLKAMVNDQVKKRLGREVRIDSVSIGLFRGVAVQSFELSERPDFSAGAFVSSRSLSVKPFFLPLLKGEVIVKSVELNGPEIRIVRKADGAFNFSDLSAADEAAGTAAPAQEPDGPTAKILVNHLRIRDGAVRFEDRTAAQLNMSVEDLDGSLDSFSFLTPFQINLACRLEGTVQGKSLAGDISFDGQIALMGDGKAVVRELKAKILKTALRAEGTVRNFSDPNGDVRLRIESFDPHTVALFADLPPFLADASLTGELTVKGSLKEAEMAGNLKIAAAGIKADAAVKAAVRDPLGEPAFDGLLGLTGLIVEKTPLAPEISVTGGADVEIRAKGTMKSVAAELTVNADRAAVRYGTLAAKEAGKVLRLEAQTTLKEPFDNPTVTAAGEAAGVTVAAAPPLPKDLRLSGPVSLRFTAKGPVDNLNMTVNLTGGDLAIAYGELFSKPAGRALTVDGHGAVRNQSDVKIDSLRIALDPMTLNAKGNVKDAAGAGNVDLRAWADPFSVEPLADMIPMLKEYKLSGKTGFDVSVKGSIDQPKILGSAAIQGVGVVPADGVSLSALVGTMRFTADSVATDDLKGKFNGSDFSVKARVENFERPSVTLEGELAQLDVGALMKAVEKPGAAGGGGPAAAPPAVPGPAPVAHTRGTFRVGSIVHPNYTGRRFRFIWELSEVGPDMGRAGGTAEFSAADGKIHDLPLAAKLNKLIKRDASEIPYDSMSAHFTITRGVLETPDFTAKGPYADMTAAGTVHLVTLMADLRLVVKIPEGSVGGSAAEWFAGEDGRPTLEATVRGPVSDPAIQVDLSKAAKRAAEEAARKGLEKLKEKFGGPSEGSGEEPTKQEKQIDKAVEEGKKALDKIFKRKR